MEEDEDGGWYTGKLRGKSGTQAWPERARIESARTSYVLCVVRSLSGISCSVGFVPANYVEKKAAPKKRVKVCAVPLVLLGVSCVLSLVPRWFARL